MEVFQDYAYYYNAFYQDKDYKAEAATIGQLLKKYGHDIKYIINFGCGTGRHDLELAKLGYQCKGIDLSSMMVKIARENAGKEHCAISFEVADVRTYGEERKYDAVISLFHVVSYQNANEDVLDTFRSARSLLDKEGILLFDVWYGPGVLSEKPSVRVKEIEDDKNKLLRIARPVMHDKENVVDVEYEVLVINKETSTVQSIKEVHNMRYFFTPELQMLLKQAGFELVTNIDCQTLGETDYSSWTSYFVARAV